MISREHAHQMTWQEAMHSDYRPLSDEEREEAEGRAKYLIADRSGAFMRCVDLAALACEQGAELDEARALIVDLRSRLDAVLTAARGQA